MAHTVLIVEDQPEMSDTLKAWLETKGFEVKVAGTGKEGLAITRKEKPDIIILDVMLPEMDGYSMCRLLKFDTKYRDIPIIMYTGQIREQERMMGQRTGADAYLVKPFEPQTLLDTMNRLLSRKGEEGAAEENK